MEYEQDGIVYKIKDGLIKGWKGTSPFKKPFWNGSEVVNGWTSADDDKEAAEEAARVTRALKLADVVVIFKGVTKDGLQEFAVIVDNAAKLDVIELP